jgi:class 3 adenylate cyclase
MMAFFGYPEAHDNDAERAARAGLELLDAIANLGEQAGRPKLAARVGIDSGAVVGAGAGKETNVFDGRLRRCCCYARRDPSFVRHGR